jgi:hypothetical protein
MFKRVMMNIWCFSLLILFVGELHAEGVIYFKCVSGVNEYLLSESDSGVVSYVNLKNGYVNFIIQESGMQNKFYLSSVPMNGGGQTRIKFSNKGYDYYLYEITHHSGEDYVFKEGVAVFKNGKVVSNKECENGDSTVRSVAYDRLTEREYDFDVSFE